MQKIKSYIKYTRGLHFAHEEILKSNWEQKRILGLCLALRVDKTFMRVFIRTNVPSRILTVDATSTTTTTLASPSPLWLQVCSLSNVYIEISNSKWS